ncbi:hypothetical protein VTO42DRAFT_8425 [Malbranchea cinnamomea]
MYCTFGYTYIHSVQASTSMIPHDLSVISPPSGTHSAIREGGERSVGPRTLNPFNQPHFRPQRSNCFFSSLGNVSMSIKTARLSDGHAKDWRKTMAFAIGLIRTHPTMIGEYGAHIQFTSLKPEKEDSRHVDLPLSFCANTHSSISGVTST